MTNNQSISYLDIDWYNDPYPGYKRLRQSGLPLWLPHDENYGGEGVWLFSHYHEAQLILKQTKSITKYVRHKRIESEHSPFDIHMLNRDGADHSRLRQLVTGFFSTSSMRELKPIVERQSLRLLKSMTEKSEGDFIRDFAEPLPLYTLAELMGIPQVDLPRIRKWSLTLSEGADSLLVDDKLKASRKATISELVEYTQWLVNHKEKNPDKDMISYLAKAQKENRLSPEETLGMVSFLLFAGHETTVSLLGSMMWLLLSHPEQWSLLNRDPKLLKSAVEETLRYESPTQRSTYRFATESITISDFTIEPGQQLAVILGSANRDEKIFNEPDRFDVTRRPNPHIAFGIGSHICLGKPLALLEAEVALREILKGKIQLHLQDQKPNWKRNSFFRGLNTLDVTIKQ